MPTRYLKPGICDSDRIQKCDAMAETLWYRLLVNVDDYGRLDARPAIVKARCFPLKELITNDEIESLLRTLAYADLIQLYTDARGCRYLQLNLWDNVPRSKESKFPAFDETCIQLYTNVQQLHTNLPVTVTVTETETETETDAGKPQNLFDEFWKVYPKKVAKADAMKAWVKNKPELSEVLRAIEWQKSSESWVKDNGKFIPYPASYLNSKRWLDEPPLITVPDIIWYESASGIEKKATELNIEKHPNETFMEFKGRVFRAAGI